MGKVEYIIILAWTFTLTLLEIISYDGDAGLTIYAFAIIITALIYYFIGLIIILVPKTIYKKLKDD